MAEQASRGDVLRTIAAFTISLLTLLLVFTLIGWLFGVLMGLTFAQGLVIPAVGFAVTVAALTPSVSVDNAVFVLIGVAVSAVITIFCGILGPIVDWLTPLTRWESCLYVAIITMSGAYLVVRHSAASYIPYEIIEAMQDDSEDEDVVMQPKSAARRRKGRRH